jgi:cysteine-S-conjugate beta-lyase
MSTTAQGEFAVMVAGLTERTLRTQRSIKWGAVPPDVLPAWVAQMDFTPPACIRDAISAQIAHGDTGYALGSGLGEAIAGWAERHYGWHITPNWVLPVPDLDFAVAAVQRAYTAPGDGVILNLPLYPPFREIVARAGRTLVDVPIVLGAVGWQLDLDALETAYRSGAKLHVLCHPHNPTGAVLPKEVLGQIARLAERYGVMVVADEVFAPLTYPDVAFTPYATVADSGVSCLSASKTWNVSGLKCGMLICSNAEQFTRLSRQTAPDMAGVLGVTATIVAFSDPVAEVWRTECLAYLDGNRRLLAELLARHLPGTGYQLPEATFLAWIDCNPLGLPQAPATVFLERKVRLYDGFHFGQEGQGWVRLNFATTRHILAEIVARMGQAVA